MALLQTRKLDKWFGGLHVTQEIDFSVKDAEIHCLVGPNGAGKSTFFHLLLGTIQASHGAILFEGRDITHRPSWQRIRDGISVKFQVPGIFQDMSVRQNVQLALQRHIPDLRARNAQTEEILEFLHLHTQSTQLAGNLSHGQKQWLEIGMAISLRPKLLLLDEPTAGMTPEETEQTGRMVQDLNRQGMAILAVEHDMNFVRQVAQRVTVLNQGQIFVSGSIADIEADERVVEIYLGKAYE